MKEDVRREEMRQFLYDALGKESEVGLLVGYIDISSDVSNVAIKEIGGKGSRANRLTKESETTSELNRDIRCSFVGKMRCC